MRFLLASHVSPFPPTSGGQQRTQFLWRALAEMGQVDLLLLVNEHNRALAQQAKEWGPEFGLCGLVEEPSLPQTALTRLLQRMGLAGLAHAIGYHRDGGRRLLKPSPEAIRETTKQVKIQDYDLLVGRYLRTVTTCGLVGTDRPLAVDVDDYHPDLLRARLPYVDPVKRRTLRRQLRFTEVAWAGLLPQCRHLWISQPEDRQHPFLEKASLLPNIPYGDGGDLPKPAPIEAIDPNIFVVLGTWTYSANAQGLDHFLRTSWKEIRHKAPQARLRVGGRVPGRWESRWRAYPGVEIAGFQEDLGQFYAPASFFIAPILFGAGTNIKVLEGAAYGRAGVVTRVAARGFQSTLVADGGLRMEQSAESIADACLYFLQNPQAAREVGEIARNSVQEHYSWKAFRDSVAEGVNLALS